MSTVSSGSAQGASSRQIHDKNVGWYSLPLTEIDATTRDLLEKYGQIPPKEVIPRLNEIVSPASPKCIDEGQQACLK